MERRGGIRVRCASPRGAGTRCSQSCSFSGAPPLAEVPMSRAPPPRSNGARMSAAGPHSEGNCRGIMPRCTPAPAGCPAPGRVSAGCLCVVATASLWVRRHSPYVLWPFASPPLHRLLPAQRVIMWQGVCQHLHACPSSPPTCAPETPENSSWQDNVSIIRQYQVCGVF